MARQAAVGDFWSFLLLFARVRIDARERFVSSGDTIEDRITGLTWEATLRPGSVTWDQAVSYCQEKGWRLPEESELSEIMGISYEDFFSGNRVLRAREISTIGLNEVPEALWTNTVNNLNNNLAAVCTQIDAWTGSKQKDLLCSCGGSDTDLNGCGCPRKSDLSVCNGTLAMRVWCVR